MQSASPITVDGVTYDRLTVNLAVSTTYNAAGERDMSIALRVIPTAITPEGQKTLDAQSHTIYRGRFSELRDAEEQACAVAMTQILQNFIASRGW